MTVANSVTGQIDGATSFDGMDDYADIRDSDSLRITSAISVSAFVRTTTNDGDMFIATKWKGFSLENCRTWSPNGMFYMNLGGVYKGVNFIKPHNDGNWHLLTVTYDSATAKEKMYLDGVLDNSATFTGLSSYLIDTSSNSLRLGRYISSYFSGALDEVRISNAARSADWIATEYNNQSIPLKTEATPAGFLALGTEQIYRLEITGSAIQTAGISQPITLYAKDAIGGGSTMTDFSGDKTVTFSGASASPRGTNPTCTDKDNSDIAFGTPTTLNFVNGVATCNLKLYKAETASITATGINSTATNLSVTVSPNTLDNFLVEAPVSSNSGAAFATTITSRDYYHNTTRTVSGATALSVNQGGTIAPTSISSGNFTDDGVWTGNLTITNIVEQPSVAITATNAPNTGTDSISILGLPANPANASASRSTDNSIVIAWQDASTVETGYKIERKMDDGSGFGAYRQIGSVAANISTFTDDAASNPTGMPIPDRRYQYRVRAYNAIGQSAAYSEDPVIHYTTPNTPSNVFGSYLSDNSFRVSYTDTAAVTDTHRIQRCSNANCGISYETGVGVFSSSPQTDSTSLYPDSRYRWQARAEAPSISSDYQVSNFEYTTPAAPAIQNTTYVSGSELIVNWTDTSAYEDGFRIEVSVDGGAYAEVTPGTNTVGAGVGSYVFTATPDRNYRFKVRAHIGSTPHNAELLSAYSSESSIVYTVSSAPTMQPPVVNSSTSILWSWLDNSAFEENFHLHFTVGSGSDANNIPANSTSHETSNLLPNTRYQTHIHSYRSDTGESEASNDSSEIYTLANIPSGLTSTARTPEKITASWNNSSNPDGTEYLIENVNTGADSGWITGLAWTDDNLLCSTEYAFRVKARNAANLETDFSSVFVRATENCPVGFPATHSNTPKAPAATADNPTGDFSLLIDGDSRYAIRAVVNLDLSAGSDTTRMAISNTSDFSQASLAPYQKEVVWDMTKKSGETVDGIYTVYAKFYTKYGVASPVVSDTIILDTTAPVLNVVALKDRYLTTDNIILSGTTEADSKVIYNLDSVRAGVVDMASDGKLILSLGNLTAGTHSLKLIAQDSLGNSSDTMQFFLNVEKPIIIAPIPTPTDPVPSRPGTSTGTVTPQPTVPGAAKPGAAAPATTSPNTPATTPPGIDVPAINTPAINNPSTNAPDLGTPTVTPEAPAALQGGWSLLEIKPIPREISPEDIEMIIEKFPEFKETFQNLGVTDFGDANRLQSASFNIPGLSEVMGLSPTELTALNLPQANTPLTELSASFKQGIPSNIVFVKTKDSNLDVNSALAFENGNPNQKISLLSGSSFQLVLKPDQPVNTIQGYLTFQENKISRVDDTNALEKVAQLLSFHRSAFAEENVEEKLVLSEFNFQDEDRDGLWTADLTTPQVAGEYELITVLNYQDLKLGAKTLRLITVVDPEGYVYRRDVDGIEARIPNTTVSIYWFNNETKQYELWDAKKYQQQNPQMTDHRGTYSFLVPPGSYYLKAEAAGYTTLQSDPFDVVVGSGVHMNLELKRQADWKDQLNWQNLLLVVFGVALFYNFYSDRKERKRRKKGQGTV